MLVEELAQYLHGLSLVTYNPDGESGDCYLAAVPSVPAEVVVISPTGGPAPDFRHGYDSPTVQLRYRAGTDPRTALERARAIYTALQSLGGVTLPGGTYVVRCMALQSDATFIGLDQNERPEYVQNFELHVRSETPHRE